MPAAVCDIAIVRARSIDRRRYSGTAWGGNVIDPLLGRRPYAVNRLLCSTPLYGGGDKTEATFDTTVGTT